MKNESIKHRGLRLRNGRWWIDCQVGGKRLRQSCGTASFTTAKAILEARRTSLAQQVHLGLPDRSKITIANLLKRYLTWAKTSKRFQSYRRDLYLVAHLKEEFGGNFLDQVSIKSIEIYQAHRKNSGASERTINMELGLLKHALNKAVAWDLYSGPNVVREVKKFKEQSRDRVLTDSELTHLLKACKESRSRWLLPLVQTALLTGLRLGELQALEWRCIDHHNRRLNVEGGKTGRRVVPLPERAWHILDALPHDTDRVFPFKTVRTAWVEALKRAAIEDFRFHDLRRQYASWLVGQKIDVVSIQRLLGHRNINTSFIYLVSSWNRLLAAADKLNEFDVEPPKSAPAVAASAGTEWHNSGTVES
ncbi:site-specific integrase [bacterium]|nr:site-specific integrase [bacterium]